MSKTFRSLITGLTVLAVGSMALGSAAAAIPKVGPIGPASKAPVPTAGLQLVNGSALVGTSCSGEFPNYDRTMSFFERPSSICVRWEDRQPVASATWELWKDLPGTDDQKIASGSLPSASLSGGTLSVFDVSLSKLPQYNEGTADQRYFVKVLSKKSAGDEKAMISARGTLIHRPKSAEPQPQPIDPYKCEPAADGYERTFALTIPKMTVNQTTSTAGDGDRDELYIKVDRVGPGVDHGAKRLPGADDYYEAKQGQSFTKTWTNQDGKNVGRPNLWSGKLRHGQLITFGISVMEQDNADLGEIRQNIMDALAEVQKVALATNNSYGAIVAAVAGALQVHASLIPQTNGHDFVGMLGLRIENKCGHIRTAWTTFSELEIEGVGTLRNEFIDSGTHDTFESRLVVHSLPVSGFKSDAPVAWGDFTQTGLTDQLIWSANGTSGSHYTFTLESRLFTPEEAEKIEDAKAAAKQLPFGK